MDIEKIRVRIMSEAYDLADRGDFEGYNAVKVMCGDVLESIAAVVAAEREACAKVCDVLLYILNMRQTLQRWPRKQSEQGERNEWRSQHVSESQRSKERPVR